MPVPSVGMPRDCSAEIFRFCKTLSNKRVLKTMKQKCVSFFAAGLLSALMCCGTPSSAPKLSEMWVEFVLEDCEGGVVEGVHPGL